MPSSSLFLGSCTTLVSILGLVSASASASASTYTLSKEYSGSSFFDGFDFFHTADPNHGFVTYVDQATALQSGLISYSNGDAFMKVDSVNTYDVNTPWYTSYGYGRPSVRITTQNTFDHGLVIAHVKHMPYGCGTWPAFWTLGADGNWPNSGEIDIVEGVNNRAFSLAALHTGGQCSIAGDSRTMTGALQSTDCRYDVATGAGSVGCAILDTDTQTYGSGLNANQGAVFAMEWTSDAIKIWAFEAGNVPDGIDTNPDPSTWGLPSQIFNGPGCDIDSVIGPQKLIFNTNFCGDFGQAVWQSEGCAAQTGFSTCAAYVAQNPSAFANAYWQFGYMKYFEKSTAPSTTSSTTTASSTTFATSTLSTTTSSSSSVVTTTSSSSSVINSPTLISTTSAASSSTTTSSAVSTSRSSSTSSAAATSTSSSSSSSYTTSSYAVSPTLITTTSKPAQSTSQSSVTVSPGITSPSNSKSASWDTWIEPDKLTTASPQHSYAIPPMGSGVPITPGWDAIEGAVAWDAWATAKTTPAAVSTGTWSAWSDKDKTITITKTWIEPCETGYTTKSTFVVTTHCGCTETPVPTIPMQTITTTYPEAWGFKTPVVVTVPVTPVAAATWSGVPVEASKVANSAQTWSTWSSVSSVSSVAADSASTWAAASWSSVYSAPAASVSDTATWSSWAAATPAAATAAPSQAWANTNGTGNPYVAKWTGAATRTSVGAGFLGVAAAVVALIL